MNSNPEAFLTFEELIEVRAALFKCEAAIGKLINQGDELKHFYIKDLESIKGAKQILMNSINREIKL